MLAPMFIGAALHSAASACQRTGHPPHDRGQALALLERRGPRAFMSGGQ